MNNVRGSISCVAKEITDVKVKVSTFRRAFETLVALVFKYECLNLCIERI